MARQAQILTFLCGILLLAWGRAGFAGEGFSTLIQPRGFGFTAPAVLNGTVKVGLVIDSGSSFTAISPAAAKGLGMADLRQAPRYPLSSAGGIVWVRLIVIDSVEVGGAVAHGVEGAVADLPSFKGADGLLGKSFLDRFSYRIDGKAKVMELAPPNNGPLFGGRGEGWWRSNAKRLARQADLFRAMEQGVDNSVRTGDTPERLLKEKLSRTDAAMLTAYYGRLLENLRGEAQSLGAPEDWTR